jgi:hypothetical protein
MLLHVHCSGPQKVGSIADEQARALGGRIPHGLMAEHGSYALCPRTYAVVKIRKYTYFPRVASAMVQVGYLGCNAMYHQGPPKPRH